MEWPAKEEFSKADVMVFYQHGDWDAKRAADIDAFLERGGGLVYVHWAVDGRKDAPGFAKRIGLAGGGAVEFRHGPLDLSFNTDAQAPDRPQLRQAEAGRRELLEADRRLAEGTACWRRRSRTRSRSRCSGRWSTGKGRVFVSIPGHYSWTFDDPLFRVLLLRGIAWAAKEPVDRFNDLVWPGADVAK